MPIYEFECLACGSVYEVIQSSTRKPEKQECSHCGASETRKLFSPFLAATASSRKTTSGSCGGGGIRFR